MDTAPFVHREHSQVVGCVAVKSTRPSKTRSIGDSCPFIRPSQASPENGVAGACTVSSMLQYMQPWTLPMISPAHLVEPVQLVPVGALRLGDFARSDPVREVKRNSSRSWHARWPLRALLFLLLRVLPCGLLGPRRHGGLSRGLLCCKERLRSTNYAMVRMGVSREGLPHSLPPPRPAGHSLSSLRPDFSYHKLTAACFLSASLEVHLLTYTLEVPFQRKL